MDHGGGCDEGKHTRDTPQPHAAQATSKDLKLGPCEWLVF